MSIRCSPHTRVGDERLGGYDRAVRIDDYGFGRIRVDGVRYTKDVISCAAR
jgi:hypothetical protein